MSAKKNRDVRDRADALFYADDAEDAVLSACFMDRGAIEVVRPKLRAVDFARERNAMAYQAIIALYDAGTEVDPLTVIAHCEVAGTLEQVGGRDRIGFLVDAVPTAANVTYHADLVKAAARRRGLRTLAHGIVESLAQGTDVAEVAQRAAGELLPFATSLRDRGFVPFKDLVLEAVRAIEDRGRPDAATTGYRTGYRCIDDHVGHFRPGDLIFVAGAPSSGKTALVLNVAVQAALRGDAGAIVSAEMSGVSLAERAIAFDASVDTRTLRRGTLTQGEYSSVAASLGRLSRAVLWVDDAGRPRIQDVVAKCRLLKSRHPELRAIFGDFIQLFQADDEGNRSLELTDISYDLKGVAKELGVPVFVTSQIDAAAVERSDSKRPALHHLRWSQGMREAGDFIVLCNRPKLYAPDRLRDTIELEFAKARDLPVFSVELEWTGRYVRVSEAAVAELRDPQYAR